MQPAPEPADARPNPGVLLERKVSQDLARSPLQFDFRNKSGRSQKSSFYKKIKNKLPVLAFDSRAKGFSTPLAWRRSSYPLSSILANSGAYSILAQQYMQQCHEEILCLQPMIPPKRSDISTPDWGMLRRSRRVQIFL